MTFCLINIMNDVLFRVNTVNHWLKARRCCCFGHKHCLVYSSRSLKLCQWLSEKCVKILLFTCSHIWYFVTLRFRINNYELTSDEWGNTGCRFVLGSHQYYKHKRTETLNVKRFNKSLTLSSDWFQHTHFLWKIAFTL